MAEPLKHIDIRKYYDSVHKDKERHEVYQYFNTKYVKKPWDNYFIIEDESRFIARKIKFFLSGSIYLFGYPNPMTKDILSFYDKRPMTLIIGTFTAKTTKNIIIQGINLNFIPEQQKMVLLETYYQVFSEYLINAERDSDQGLIGQAKNLGKFLTDWSFMTKAFVKQGKIPLTFAIRNYEISGIINPVLIEIEDWPMIPFFVPKDLEGKAPAQIYADYYEAKKQKNSENKKKREANKKWF